MGGRTSTAVDEDAKQGENFTWPKRKIFLNNISCLLPVPQVRRLQIKKNQRLTSQGFPRMITIGWVMAISMLCCDQLSIICFVCFFKVSHNRSDSGLLKGSESFVKKLWRRTRLGQCLWCTRSNFLQSRTHWSQGAWKKLSSRPSCQIFQQWLPASIGKRHDSHHHHHNHHHHHHLSSGMWYLGLHNHIF